MYLMNSVFFFLQGKRSEQSLSFFTKQKKMTVEAPPTATPMEADAAAAAAPAATAAPAVAAPEADAGSAPAPMEADPPAKEAAAAGGDKPADAPSTAAAAAPASDAAAPPADANGAAAKESNKKSFPRCQLRLRLDSGCYLARMAKDDKEKEEAGKDKANGDGDVAAAAAAVELLPQEVAAERGWLTDEHALALERKLIEAASRLGNAAPPLWSLRSERVSEEFLFFFRSRRRLLLSSSSVGEPTNDSRNVPAGGAGRRLRRSDELGAAGDGAKKTFSSRRALASEDQKSG